MRFTNLRAILIGSIALLGCSSDPADPGTTPPADLLAPPPEGMGVQFKMVTEIGPGVETERCQFFKAPAEGLYVNREEVRFTQGSHHVLLFKTSYNEIPTTNKAGAVVDTSKVLDCPDGPNADWDAGPVVGGSQSFDGDSMLNTLPSDVAVHLPPGTVVLMNVHYVNASSEALVADARINLYSIPKEQVKHEAGLLFFYNPFIHIPAGGKGTARMRCPVTQDISIVNVQSHMHRRGVNFVADVTDGDGNKLQELYTNTEWEQVPVRSFDPLLTVKAGQALDYRCDYENKEATDINQGPRSKDEMCMLLGAYYPRNAALETCQDGTGFLAATWIGNGTADGAASLMCMANATSAADFYGCVVNSCAKIGPEVSDFVRCQGSAGFGACISQCSGPDTSMCQSCVSSACNSAQTALSSATCQ